jgi:hypothetical protein
MKGIDLTRGDLPTSGGDEFETATRSEMYRLKRQKSAEAVVPRPIGERAEQQRFRELERNERNIRKAEHRVWTRGLHAGSRGGTPR